MRNSVTIQHTACGAFREGRLSEVAHKTKVGKDGGIQLPEEYQLALGIREGDQVVLRMRDGELVITTSDRAIRRLQQLVRERVPSGRSLADELIAERRAEAERE